MDLWSLWKIKLGSATLRISEPGSKKSVESHGSADGYKIKTLASFSDAEKVDSKDTR
jgi:hypothetical protein